jgi:type I restriction enzyme M protein
MIADALISDPGDRFEFVLTNPPFGKKSTVTIFNGENSGKAEKESLIYERQDFWATTSNKQLNFLQHVKTLLKVNGFLTTKKVLYMTVRVRAKMERQTNKIIKK